MSFAVTAGNVYQDGEGTLMVALTDSDDGGRSSVFGCFLQSAPVPGSHELVVHPLTLVFDTKGNNLGDNLRYPNQNAFKE